MSEEKNVDVKNETVVETKQNIICSKNSKVTWVKNIIAAIVGAIISFGVTFGVMTAEQGKQIDDKLAGINTKAELIVENLKNGKIAEATELANQIAQDSKDINEVVVEAKEKTVEKVDEIKKTTQDAKENIKDAIEKK